LGGSYEIIDLNDLIGAAILVKIWVVDR